MGRRSHCKDCDYIYVQENKERIATKRKLYYKKNKEIITEKQKQYRLENREFLSERQKQWSKNNEEKRKYQKRKSKLKIAYGITPEQVGEMIKSQNSRCAICGTENPGGTHNKWNIDHDHKTGKVRGILCHYCNVTLGNVNDSVVILEKMIEYLKKHGGENV